MSQPTPSAPKGAARFREFMKLLWHLIKKDWTMKLTALLLAVALWAGLITQDPTLTREKHFTNVNVTVSGADTLKRYGYVVTSDLDALLDDVSFSVDVPQMQYANAQASNYNVRVDLTRIKAAGEQEVKILTTNSNAYGTVTALSPSTIRVMVDEYVTRYRIPVSVVTEGETPAGYYAGDPSFDPALLAVSGPARLVEAIARAEAVVNLSELPAREGKTRQAVSFRLLDENGNQIDSEQLEITSESVLLDSVIVEQEVFSLKEIVLSDLGLVRGTPADGYEVKGVYITPSVVTAAGRKTVLDSLNILYTNSFVDVTGLSESVNETVYIRQPSRISYISADEVTVAVEIGPVMDTRTLQKVPLSIDNAGEGLTAACASTTASVTITGPAAWLKTLSSGDVRLYCDVQGLGEGTYDLPILCRMEQEQQAVSVVDVQPSQVRVIITAE